MKITQKEIDQVTKRTDDDVEKLNYREKQRHFAVKSKLCKTVHLSKSKDGKGHTYINKK